jgi:hypothetical protein
VDDVGLASGVEEPLGLVPVPGPPGEVPVPVSVAVPVAVPVPPPKVSRLAHGGVHAPDVQVKCDGQSAAVAHAGVGVSKHILGSQQRQELPSLRIGGGHPPASPASRPQKGGSGTLLHGVFTASEGISMDASPQSHS